MKKYKFDKYEQEIIDLYEENNIESIPRVKEEIARYRTLAKQALQKKKLIEINILKKS